MKRRAQRGASAPRCTARRKVWLRFCSGGKRCLRRCTSRAWRTSSTWWCGGDSLSATLSQYLVERIMSTANVKVMTNSQVTAVEGEEIPTDWLFVCMGGEPGPDLMQDQ